jgi:hypothetical protein
MNNNEIRSPVSFVVNVARLPKSGLPVKIVADESQRVELAKAHGLLSVENYRADLVVEAWKRNGVRVSGTVQGAITQECIATLEPLQTTVKEKVSSVFLPEDSKLGRAGFEGGGEILLDFDGPDSPETFSGDTLDVGALAEEFFGLGIDPYPRKSGLPVEPEGEAEEIAEPRQDWQEKLRRLTQKS